MNEDERGITPADCTTITIQRLDREWWVIIEQGNGDKIKEIKLTEMERVQLAMMLEQPILESVSFVDYREDRP